MVKDGMVMKNETEFTPVEMELEAALGSLQPVAVAIERDRLMYRAGQSSARRRNLAWPILSVALTLLLGVSLLHQPETRGQTVEVEKLVYITKPAPATQPALHAATQSTRSDLYQLQVQAKYVKLRDKVLTEGLDALPIREISSSGPAEERGSRWQDYLPNQQPSWWKLNVKLNGDQS
jgi:hypothetical protein